MLRKAVFGLIFGTTALLTMGCEDKKTETEQHQETSHQNTKHAKLPADFDADKYLKLNPDVDAHYAHLSLQERQEAATKHYLNQGVLENRTYK